MLAKTTSLRWGLALLLFLISSITFAQRRTITGTVTGANSQPVPAATVSVRGTTINALTDEQGRFSIAVPTDRNVLVVTSVGFENREVTIGSSTTLNVSLTARTTQLNEIVVTGYSAQRRKDITGSVAVVDVNNLKQVPSGTTESLLQGQAAGVTVINSGSPGGGSNVRIRGITSIGPTDPLVIIDGTPGSLHDLNVNDIESMQVLKDAGAAAIYGVRGSNGVVVVTTKRGRSGKVRVSYDAYYGTQRPLKEGFHIANTEETAQAYFRQAQNSGVAFNHKQFGTGSTYSIPDYITPTRAKEGDPNTNPSTYALYTNQITRANKAGTDWFHEVFKPAHIQSHSISASGGGDKSSYYFSFSYFDQPGTLISTYLKRYSVRVNTTFNVKDKIRLGENAYVFYRQNPGFTNQNEGNIISHSYRESPIIPVYDIMGNFAGTGSQGLGNAQNPVANALRTSNNRANNWVITGNVFAEVDFLRHLTARTAIGGTIENYYFYNFSYTAYENAENNKNPNSFNEGSGYNSSRTWTNTLTYNNVLGAHNIKVLVGTEAILGYGRNMNASRGNYYITNPNDLSVDPNLFTLNFGSPTTQTNSGGPYQNSLFSQFGRLDYSYGDRYLLSATVRRDGSSAFAPEQRWGIFPSFTAGWRLSRESFFPQTSWLSELKLRGGWGKLGSLSNINATNQFSFYGQSAASSFYDIGGVNNNAVFGLRASQSGNTATTWEEDIVTNVGLDAALFKNKLDFSIEWYKKDISGLLFRPPVAATFGDPTVPFVNQGNISNKGIDASATYHGTLRRDLRFDVTGTFTSYDNKVVALPNGVKYQDRGSSGSGRIGSYTRLQPGQPVGAFFGYEMIGLFQSADDVAKSPTQQDALAGRMKFRDVNGDKKIDADDRTFFGNPNPDFTAGLNLAVTYKNFDLSSFFYASVGNDVINYVRYWTDFPQVFQGAVSKDAVYNSWTPQNTGAKVPILENSANFSNTTQFNSYYMESGSFLKLKSLVIGYTIPSAKLSRFGIDRLRIYAQGANLFQITNYTGLDPELTGSNLGDNSNFGIDFGNYPANQKMYTFGVNLSF
jgi:TonB-dependent starch-binding outer membrane protein SusC